METIARTQALIRLPSELLLKAKYMAKQNNMSFNAFVEQALEMSVNPVIPKLPKDFKISHTVEALSGIIPAPTKEELESDDRLAYIWNKGL